MMKGFKILVADDSAPIRLIIKRFLNDLGQTTTFTTNGTETLKALLSESFDFALIDMQMPEMDGSEVVTKAREKGINIPIYAMTTADDSKILSAALECGYNGYFPKPIIKEHLNNLIMDIFRQTRS